MAESFFITKEYDSNVAKTILKRYWWIPVLTISIFMFTAFIYLRYTKPQYQSSILIQLAEQDNAKQVIDIENINADPTCLNSDVELLRSQFMFESALKKLNVNVSLYHKGNILTEEKYLTNVFNVQPYFLSDSSLVNTPIFVKFDGNDIQLNYSFAAKSFKLKGKVNEHIKNEHFDVIIKVANEKELKQISNDDILYFSFNSIETLSSKFLANLEVQVADPNAKTISIKFSGYNPRFCTDMVNAVASSFFDYDLDQKRRGSENILKFIDQQLDSLSQELKQSKDSLVGYQRKSQIFDPESVSSGLSSNSNRLQDQLFTIEDELSGLNDVNSRLSREPNRLEIYRLLPEMLGRSYESALSQQIENLHSLLERKEDLLFSVTDENPEIKALNIKINSRMASIRKSVGAMQSRLLSNAKVIRSKIAAIEGTLFTMPEKKMEFGRLKGIQELNDKYYNLLTEKKVMYAISDAGFSSSNRILKRADINMNPVKPNSSRIYMAFFGFGFIIGAILLFIRYIRFNEINYTDDLKKLLPKSISHLGAIPLMKLDMDFSEVLVHKTPNSLISESLRNIRTNLNFVSPGYKTIAISSSVSGEGKTFIALNLAAIIAMSGKRTVLLDLDLRKPKIHFAFNVKNKKGMSNALIKETTWQDCVQHSDIENLDFITAGATPPNPSELMLSKTLENILEELKAEYDVILIDNPPVGVVSDGVQLLSIADIPIYVFKSHFSKRSFIERVEELIDVQKVEKLCVILNGEVGNKKACDYYYGSEKYFESEPKKKMFLRRIFGRWIS
jgi:capsular exopolysaccharide synthesis family protein